MGGHDGPVVQTGDDLLGHVVNVAARVTDTASGGETIVTTSLRDGAGPVPGVVFEDPHEEHLKGIEEAFEVCRVHHETL